MKWINPYAFWARFYDWFSGEGLVYRAGRVAGVALLDLHEGSVVLDLGCGTGLNFPLLAEAVGPGGMIIGLDSSPHMLEVARRRIRRRGIPNVVLIEADAVGFDASLINRELAAAGRHDGVDAFFASYALSVFPSWREAWDSCRGVLRPGGRIGVVDMQAPRGAAAILSPVAHLACWLGGSDIHAHPWTAVEDEGTDVRRADLRGGHIVAVVGTMGKPA